MRPTFATLPSLPINSTKMKLEERILQIHEAIIEERFLEALDELARIPAAKQDHGVELLNLKARVVKLQKEERLDVRSSREIDLEYNKIRLRLFELTQELEKSAATESKEETQPGEVVFLRELLRHLEISQSTFQAQRNVQKKLLGLLKDRLPDWTYASVAEGLQDAYPSMTAQEKRLHHILRGYTKNILYKTNQDTRVLLQGNYTFFSLVEGLAYLEKHLLIWLAKFESLFEDDEAVCLIHVGPDEGVRFPVGIEDRIQAYLADNWIDKAPLD